MSRVSKQFSAIVTASRASARTVTNSAGTLTTKASGEWALDYDPSALTVRGLIVEEQRTNIIHWSTDTTSWTQAEITQDGTVTAPDGSTVPIWLASVNALSHRLTRTGTGGAAGNTTHAPSIFVHIPSGSDVVGVRLRARATGDGQTASVTVAGSGAGATFTFASAGPFGAGAPAAIVAGDFRSEYWGNGWHRIWYASALSTTTTAASQLDISFTCTATENAAGTANTRAAFWQGQLEQGAFASSPIITTGAAAATRLADSLTVGTMNPWFNATEGTMYAEFMLSSASATASQYAIQLGSTSAEYLSIYREFSSGRLVGRVMSGAVSQAFLYGTAASTSANVTIKGALGYKANDFGFSGNGEAGSTDVSGLVPVGLTSSGLGQSSYTTTVTLNGWLRKLIYYPARKTNAELVTLTT